MDPTKQQMSDVLRALNARPELRGDLTARRKGERRASQRKLDKSRKILIELHTFLDCENRDAEGMPCDKCCRKVTAWAIEHQSKLRLRL